MQFEPLPPVPGVALARRLRRIPLFRFVSVDELFRIARIAEQVRYEPGSTVQEKGSQARFIQVLLEGRFDLDPGGDGARSLEPPAMLGFREVLEGTAIQEGARAAIESIALVMDAQELRTLLSANIELAQGLFRTLLEGKGAGPSLVRGSGRQAPVNGSLKTVDKALHLQEVPLFARTSGDELFALAGISRDVSIPVGESLFSEGHPSSICLLLAGEVSILSGDDETLVAKPGDCLGIDETLAGADWSYRALAREPARALTIERDALFELLADRLDLLQGLFGAIFIAREAETRHA